MFIVMAIPVEILISDRKGAITLLVFLEELEGTLSTNLLVLSIFHLRFLIFFEAIFNLLTNFSPFRLSDYKLHIPSLKNLLNPFCVSNSGWQIAFIPLANSSLLMTGSLT